MDKYFRHIEEGFLTEDECNGFIEMAEGIGFEEAKIQTRGGGEVMNKDVRDNDRVIFQNGMLAKQLWELIKPLVPSEVDEYKAIGLNERFRFYRYRDGQQFKIHPDGAFKRNTFEHSKITVMVYLNENFEEGETVFVAPYQIVEPKTGKLLLFAHNQLHKGSSVPKGTKYVLRTDVMYRREPIEGETLDEVFIGDRNVMFLDMTQEEISGKLKSIASDWNEKGYMITTGRSSENKLNELWAIKIAKKEDNNE